MNRLPLLIASLLLIALAFGCGGAAEKINARIATGFVAVQAGAEPIVRQGRVEAAVAAAQAVRDRGGNSDEATHAATEAAESWACAVNGHRLFGIAVRTYVDSLTLATIGGTFQLDYLLPLLGRALASYRELRACLASLGSNALPESPAFFDLIPTEWSLPYAE